VACNIERAEPRAPTILDEPWTLFWLRQIHRMYRSSTSMRACSYKRLACSDYEYSAANALHQLYAAIRPSNYRRMLSSPYSAAGDLVPTMGLLRNQELERVTKTCFAGHQDEVGPNSADG
jgi:hypothetical protein